jgi:hypothetical protein
MATDSTTAIRMSSLAYLLSANVNPQQAQQEGIHPKAAEYLSLSPGNPPFEN